jgi:hypothetical protein
MRPIKVLGIVALLAMGAFLSGCETMEVAGTAQPAGPAKPPVVQLDRVEINHIQPFFIAPRIDFKDCNNPGKVGGYGYTSTLSLAYVFKIQNPNPFPVMLDELTFTAAFEDFDVNMPTVYEDQWIPPGKTNELRVVAVQEAQATIASLSVGGLAAERIKKMGTKQADLVKKWWDTIGDMAFPIQVKNGVAVFQTPDGKTVQSTFQGVFPPPKK